VNDYLNSVVHFDGAQERTRTFTPLRELVPETLRFEARRGDLVIGLVIEGTVLGIAPASTWQCPRRGVGVELEFAHKPTGSLPMQSHVRSGCFRVQAWHGGDPHRLDTPPDAPKLCRGGGDFRLGGKT
jgi:hypothetical protein